MEEDEGQEGRSGCESIKGWGFINNHHKPKNFSPTRVTQGGALFSESTGG